jgi:hypothetical protein
VLRLDRVFLADSERVTTGSVGIDPSAISLVVWTEDEYKSQVVYKPSGSGVGVLVVLLSGVDAVFLDLN